MGVSVEVAVAVGLEVGLGEGVNDGSGVGVGVMVEVRVGRGVIVDGWEGIITGAGWQATSVTDKTRIRMNRSGSLFFLDGEERVMIIDLPLRKSKGVIAVGDITLG